MISMLKPKRRDNAFSLPTSLILTLFMSFWSYFFIVARAPGLQKPAAWLVFAGTAAVYFLLLYTGDVSKYRRILFVSVALLFFPEFIAQLLESRGSMMLSAADMFNNETPFCHIVIPMVTVPFVLTKSVIFPANVNWIYMMLIIWLAATLTIGRGWCSWACFYGGWDEGASAIAKKTRVKIDPSNDKVRYFAFAVLAFVVLASLSVLAPVYCEWLCPFKAITEFGEVDSLRAYMTTIAFILIFFGLVIVLPFLTKKRTQCMSFCPFGAFQSMLNKFNLYRVRIDTDKCIHCMACVKTCRTLSLKESTITENKGEPLLTCTRCGECMSVCPKGAIDYSYVFCNHKTGAWMILYDKLNGKKAPTGSSIVERKPLTSAKHFFRHVKHRYIVVFPGSLAAKVLKRVVFTVYEILSPRALFTFSGFFMGMVFLSSFGTGTVHRFLNLFINGSFLLK